jgi:hypothetical protein
MGEIYGQTVRALAWLGKSSEMGAMAFKHLSRLGMMSRSVTAFFVITI